MTVSWPLVGRSEELAFVDRALARSDVSGIVVSGEAGVGKTRVTHEAMERATAGGLPADRVFGTSIARSIPFGAFSPLLPPLEDVARPGLLRRAADALGERGGGDRFVLGIDDAHLLDDLSAALVHQLLAVRAAIVVASLRSGEPAPDAIVRLWKEGLAERLELQPLSRLETGELLEAALGAQVEGTTQQRIWEMSRGNPLFITELVTAAVDEESLVLTSGLWRWTGELRAVPRLNELVEARLRSLDPVEREAVELVAVAEPIPVTILESVADSQAIISAERRGLLATRTEGKRSLVGLAHPLYGELLRAKTPPLTLRSIKRRLALALEETGARRREDLLRVASWRVESGSTEAPQVLVAASHQASSAFDFVLAQRLAEAAVDAEAGRPAEHALARSLIGRGDFAEADAVLERLETEATDAAERGSIAAERANNLYWHVGDGDEALAVIERARADSDAPKVRDALAAVGASILLFGGNTDRAIEAAAEVLERASPEGEGSIEAAMTMHVALTVAGRLEQAVELGEQFREIASRHTAEVPFGPLFFNTGLVLALAFSGRLAEAAAAGEAAYRNALARRATIEQSGASWALSWVDLIRGRADSAARWSREAASLQREVDIFRQRTASLGILAQAEARLGNLDVAEAALAEAESTRIECFRMDTYLLGLSRAWIAAAAGELTAARSLARTYAETAGEMGQRTYQVIALHDALRLGNHDVAGELNAIAKVVDGELVAAFAAHAAALVAGDASALEAVSRSFESLDALLYAAEAAAEASAAHREQGRQASARSAAERALMLASVCGPVTTPALAGIDPDPLTAREREVALLASGGASTREIAERLVVSVRTVENHLHNVYGKLGISGRDGLESVLRTGC